MDGKPKREMFGTYYILQDHSPVTQGLSVRPYFLKAPLLVNSINLGAKPIKILVFGDIPDETISDRSLVYSEKAVL